MILKKWTRRKLWGKERIQPVPNLRKRWGQRLERRKNDDLKIISKHKLLHLFRIQTSWNIIKWIIQLNWNISTNCWVEYKNQIICICLKQCKKKKTFFYSIHLLWMTKMNIKSYTKPLRKSLYLKMYSIIKSSKIFFLNLKILITT